MAPAAAPPLALSIADAARVLSVSRDTFERHVMPELRLVRVGRRLLVPMRELDDWLERNSAIPLVAELPASRSTGLCGGVPVDL
jgi:excisionase family DNA binding protein